MRGTWRIRGAGWLAAAALLVFSTACVDPLEEAARRAENNPELLHDAAIQAIGSGDLALSERRLRRVVELAPKVARYWQTLSLVKLHQREWLATIEVADRALALNPLSTDARNNRGVALLNLGRPGEAEQEFRKVLEDPTYPQRVNPRFNLGLSFLRQNRSAEALAEFYQIQTKNPNLPGLWSAVGEAREAAGELDKAVANYLEAVKRDEHDLISMFRLAGCLERLGRKDVAAKYYRHVVAEAPATREGHDALKRLDEISRGVDLPREGSD